VKGRNPFDCLWDDSLGAGLQMALFEAGNFPICEHGVRLVRWDDDGSEEWRGLAERAEQGPVRSNL